METGQVIVSLCNEMSANTGNNKIACPDNMNIPVQFQLIVRYTAEPHQ